MVTISTQLFGTRLLGGSPPTLAQAQGHHQGQDTTSPPPTTSGWVGGQKVKTHCLKGEEVEVKPTVTSTVSLPQATSKEQFWQTDISWFTFPQ